MTRIAKAPARTYRSELRAQQADETRARILDATVRVMARGLASLSIPAVAREAGVSVPTVYRHFATKRRPPGGDLPARRAAGRLRRACRPRLDRRASGRCARATSQRLDSLGRPGARGHGKPGRRRGAGTPACRIGSRCIRRSPIRSSRSSSEADQRPDRAAPGGPHVRHRRCACGATISALSVDEAADDVDWIVQARHRRRTPRGSER